VSKSTCLNTYKPKVSKPKDDTIGRAGEREACKFLQLLGYKVILKNWRCTEGEIDIVALDESTLVIVEVKTRASEISANFSPFEAVDARKEAKLKRLANRLIYLERLKIKPLHPQRLRFDVIGVLYSRAGGQTSFKFEHLKEAFSY
jgi:putative endonuclease